MIIYSRFLILLALLAIGVACSRRVQEVAPPEPARLTAEMVGASAIVKMDRFPVEHRSAIVAATRELRNQDENPYEFFAEVGASREEFVTLVELWHRDVFLPETAGIAGNPGGKCRSMYFDTRSGNIIRTLFWQ